MARRSRVAGDHGGGVGRGRRVHDGDAATVEVGPAPGVAAGMLTAAAVWDMMAG